MSNVVFFVLVALGWINCSIYLVGYDRKVFGSWRYYVMGRHLMGFMASLWFIFSLWLASFFFGGIGWVAWSIGLGLVVAFLTHRNWLLFSSGWRSRDRRGDQDYSDYTQTD